MRRIKTVEIQELCMSVWYPGYAGTRLSVAEAHVYRLGRCGRWRSRRIRGLSSGEISYLAPLGSENISAPYFKQ
jgi:hypothetical protein